VDTEQSSTPTTLAVAVDASTLLAAMPADSEVPGDWVRYHEPHNETEASADGGVCDGPDDPTRAIASGSPAMADGPAWDLPNSGWIGFDIYAFPNEADAIAFLAATAAQYTMCAANPSVDQRTEGDADFAGEFMPETVVWQMTELVSSADESTSEADQLLRAQVEHHATTTYEGIAYEAVTGWIDRFERHGRVVIDFWLGGDWGVSGWTSFEGAYQPTNSDIDTLTNLIRSGVVARLSAAGAL
jgi:hypothetical protein